MTHSMQKFMEEERIRKDELELQHFGFSSTQFTEQLRELIHKDIKSILDTIRNAYLSEGQHTENESWKDELENIHLKYKKETNIAISQFEPKIRELFALPRNAALKLDFTNHYPAPDVNIEELQNEIAVLEKKYLMEKSFNYVCAKHLSRLQTVDSIYEKTDVILNQQNFMLKIPDNKKLKHTLQDNKELIQFWLGGAQETCPDYVDHYSKYLK